MSLHLWAAGVLLIRYCLLCGTKLESAAAEDAEARLRCPSCDFVLYENPTPVVAAIVEMDGEVLLVRNHGWPEKWFGLVSGFLEKNEDPRAAVLREVREELGLDAELVSLIGNYTFEQRNEVILAYHLRAVGEIHLGDEIAEVKRVPIEKLRPWSFGTGHAVRDWLEART